MRDQRADSPISCIEARSRAGAVAVGELQDHAVERNVVACASERPRADRQRVRAGEQQQGRVQRVRVAVAGDVADQLAVDGQAAGVDPLLKANRDLERKLQEAVVRKTLPAFFPKDDEDPFEADLAGTTRRSRSNK